MSESVKTVVLAVVGPFIGDLADDQVSPEELKRRLGQIVAVCTTASVRGAVARGYGRERVYREAVEQIYELATGVRRLPTLRRLRSERR